MREDSLGPITGDIAHTFVSYLRRVTLIVGMPAEMEGKGVSVQTMVAMSYRDQSLKHLCLTQQPLTLPVEAGDGA